MGWNILIDEIILDVKTAKKMDPAAKSYAEILFLYQGGHALITYRIAHWLYIRKHFFLARWISQHSRKRTLIEIHTFCTRFCENESNLKVIQDIMGHADITTTMDIYAEATQEKKQEVMANLQGKIF